MAEATSTEASVLELHLEEGEADDELIHIGEYARILKQHLPKECFEPVPIRLLGAVPYLAVIGVGFWLTIAVPMHWAVQLLVSVAIGMSYGALGFLGHEVLHGAVVRTPWIRNLVGQICFWPFNLGPRLWRRWHNVEHHANAQHPEDDPDTMHTLEEFHRRPSLQLLYRLSPWLRAVLMFLSLSVWFSIHSFRMLVTFIGDFPRSQRWIVLAQYLLPLTFWLALPFVIGWRAWVFAYVLPLLVANFLVMSYISTNHLINPLTPINDPLAGSLTVRTARWIDVLHFNFSHHTEHHIFPAMNPRYAPLVQRYCKELWPERYNEMPHWEALMVVCLTPRLYLRYNQLVDPFRRLVYPVLGHGLRPGQKLQPRPIAGRQPLAGTGSEESI